jgi:hypothetical protein
VIIKGKSRAGPSQLAYHLGRADTNERVEILQLDSAGTTADAFRDWQTYTLATKGKLGLYHANIDPDAKYEMTPEQWMRAVEILEEELGLQGQPRAVVMHEKNGREHIHVVWARTDMDTMTLRSDSQNYQAHERASLRLEQEFGHELVPGKHAKRDREAQRDMPRAEVSHDEWQQAERSGMDHRQRKAQVTALFEASDSGPAFKAALEDAGYVLVRGDKRGYVLLDTDGRAHSLSRQLPGVKAADLRAFMVDIDLDRLPGVAEARAEIRNQRREVESEPGAETTTTPEQASHDRLAKMLDALAQRHASERADQERRHSEEFDALQRKQGEDFDRAFEDHASEAMKRRQTEQPPEPGALAKFWQHLREAVSDDARTERLAEEARHRAEIDARDEAALRIIAAGLHDQHRREFDDLVTRQGSEIADLKAEQAKDRASRIADEERARQLEREYAERQREAQERTQDMARDGPERDDRVR